MNKEKFLKKVSKKVGKALADYSMIKDGDKILVGVSGGKDSLVLIDILAEKKKCVPVKFEIYVGHIDFGFYTGWSSRPETELYIKNLGVPYFVIKKPLPETEKKINCFWCSWNRRKELFLLADKIQCNKIALAHNLDDIIVTFFMNMFYHSEISSMPVKLEMFKGRITLIRPLVYVTEDEVQKYAEYKNLPVVNSMCKYYDKNFSKREYLKKLVTEVSLIWPNVRYNILHSFRKIRVDYLPVDAYQKKC